MHSASCISATEYMVSFPSSALISGVTKSEVHLVRKFAA